VTAAAAAHAAAQPTATDTSRTMAIMPSASRGGTATFSCIPAPPGSNRAVTLYEFIDEELAGGAEVIARRDGRDNVVKLL
jgi:hypothetical protein